MSSNASIWLEILGKIVRELSDETLELHWYANQYVLACCAGNKRFAPGLYGNFITTDNPNWHGDIHLNYNYQAPFYALVSSNHVGLTDCFLQTVEPFIPEAEYYAKNFENCRGVHFP